MASHTEQHLSQLSHHVDAMEELTEGEEFFSIAQGSTIALRNLQARLLRLQKTIEIAALS